MVDPNTLPVIASVAAATASGPVAPLTAPVVYGIVLIGGSIACGIILWLPGSRAGQSRWNS